MVLRGSGLSLQFSAIQVVQGSRMQWTFYGVGPKCKGSGKCCYSGPTVTRITQAILDEYSLQDSTHWCSGNHVLLGIGPGSAFCLMALNPPCISSLSPPFYFWCAFGGFHLGLLWVTGLLFWKSLKGLQLSNPPWDKQGPPSWIWEEELSKNSYVVHKFWLDHMWNFSV